ncbi:putative oxidoreductase [bacterium BMS3Abin04]|nr:putative oxidoreductase [bacterium BMS3Abin04]
MEYSFDNMRNKVCVITGGGGIIGSLLAKGLAAVGIKTAIIDIAEDSAKKVSKEIKNELGTDSIGVKGDVLNVQSMNDAKKTINDSFGKIDYLINGAGGNSPKATTAVEFIEKDYKFEDTFFGLDTDGFDFVFSLNFKGTVIPTMVIAKEMITKQQGVIVNISSMNSFRPLTKIPAYSAAKASVNNFTEWLAVHFAKMNVRVNAIAPGFFLTNQNRFLLIDEKTNALTPRGKQILNATPMNRFGSPEELVGTTLFLLSDLSKFITGVVIPIDGGFNAYSGV